MSHNLRKSISMLAACLLLLFLASSAFAEAGRVPKLMGAKVLGPEDQAKQINVTFWLKQRDQRAFDELVRQMYDRSSSNYHHWLTLGEYKARFAPADADLATLRKHLAAHHLSVVNADGLNLYVTARGSVADVQRATGVQINRVQVAGEMHRLPSAEPAIPGAAGKVVAAVQGLADLNYQNYAMLQPNPETGQAVPMVPLAHVGPAQQFFNSNCLRASQTRNFRAPGGKPYAIYSGARYGTNINNGPPDLPYCGYNAPQVAKAYGLTDLYKQKLDGTGQTVAIVDAFGSDTIFDDANLFNEVNGLPQFSQGGNFSIYYPTGPTSCGNACINGNWNIETTLDVEWSHSVAPGATIALLLAADNSFTNLDLSVLYAIETQLAGVVSNSYGIGEIILETYLPSELTVQNNLSQLGASLGISVNFSTGDSGDFFLNYGVTTVSMPAASPYSTAVGGTSLFLNTDRSIKLQTGWGNNETRIADVLPNPPIIPPLHLGFVGGAGGGESQVWAKPSFQNSVPGSGRLIPDIAFLADPFTGVEIVITDPASGQTGLEVIGGTSLACPMFSGLWAVTSQAAGRWLGQAAPLLYDLPEGAITDVRDVKGPDNVSGTIHNPPASPVYESPRSLAQPLQNTMHFTSALFNGFSSRWYVLSFGTDSSLTTAPGWDNVTGLGTPNGANFVNAIVDNK